MSTKATPKHKITLYGYWRSSATWRVRIYLAFKGLEYENKIVSLIKGDQKDAEFAKLNPMGQIPCLVFEEEGQEPLVLNQSLTIMKFLDMKFPEKTMTPADIRTSLKVDELALDIVSGIHPLQNLGVCISDDRRYRMDWFCVFCIMSFVLCSFCMFGVSHH